ncbi:MAG: aminopeptidase N [Actinomycetales bacterium]|nr:aminopeptidase N [Candidatus Lutibacillus vidarii]
MPGTNLTRSEARERAALISVERYDVDLHLGRGPSTFTSRTTVRFRCAQPGASTFIDLIADSVESVTLNGVELDPARAYADSRVALPGLATDNVLTIEATCRYMRSGEGLHRFVDPVDSEVYLYSQFEVPDSRRMFAVFEQPDLKAEFSFTVTAPARWEVISVMPTPEPTPAGTGTTGERTEELATWAFAPTPRISSYVTALHAGPYLGVRDSVSTRAGEIPLGVFCRASLLEHLDADNILDATKRGFAFFENEFGVPYPFAKYDQVFAPEYNMGAMENAGAVTITEMYVFRAKVTEAIIERRALTILHELAHMWFGDLVTMRWWDDLWLNESFAEWASTVCMAESTEWRRAWTTFSIHEKSWAYEQDQMSSTHPIAADMAALEDVAANFDGITYAKGAAVLKQLVAWVGRDAFTAGLRAYFAKHAWGNTELSDLLVELEQTSGRDLRPWAEQWLTTSGVTTLRSQTAIDAEGRYTEVAVLQSSEQGGPAPRPHRLGIGLYDVDGTSLHRRRYLEVDIAGERTDIPELVGEREPDLLLLNDEDLAYCMTRLDPRSMATALAHPRGYPDQLPKAVVLIAAWDMVREGELAARDFVELAMQSLIGEEHSPTLKVLLGEITIAVLRYVTPEHRDEVRAGCTATLRELAEGAVPGSDAQHQLITAYAGLSSSEADAAYLRGLLDGTVALAGLDVDVELRWVLLRALAAMGRVDDATIEAEGRADPTNSGQERLAQTLAARPTAHAKEQAWARGVEQDDTPNAVVQSLGRGFVRSVDPATLEPYVARFHDALIPMWQSRTVAIGTFIVEEFYPIPLAGQGLLDVTNAWLAAHPDAPVGLVRMVKERRDECARATRAQQVDRAR